MPGSLLQRNQLNVERGCLLSHYKSSDDSFNSCQNHLSRSQQDEQNSTLDKDENPALHKHCLSSSEQLPSLNYSVKTNQPTHHATTHLHSVIPSPLILQLTLRKSWCSSDRFMQTSKSWQSTHWCHSVSPSAAQAAWHWHFAEHTATTCSAVHKLSSEFQINVRCFNVQLHRNRKQIRERSYFP